MSADTESDCYATDDESLCAALDDECRETIAELAEARGQTSAGLVKAAIAALIDRNEYRIVEFDHAAEARDYYRSHRRKELEFDGAYEELSPEGYYEKPAQPLHELLKGKAALHGQHADAAARWLDRNDPDTVVVTTEYGSPEAIPELDSEIRAEVQHGTDDADGDADDRRVRA